MQEENHAFKIIICSDNENIIQNLNQKIDLFLKNIPYDLKIVKDGVRAINELGKNFCQLFITDSNLVGIDIHYLLQHYQEVNGGGSIIVLKNKESKEIVFDNCEVIDWPIAAWSEFEDCLKNSIPEELKIKYGLEKVIPLKFHSLNNLIAKYKDNSTNYSSLSALIIMPKTFFEKNLSTINTDQEMSDLNEKITLIGENFKKTSFIVEIIFLVIMISLNIYILKNNDFESDSIFSTRVLITLLTGFIFFVLVSNWTLRRYILQTSTK